MPAASINNSSIGCASLTLQINNQPEQTYNCTQIGSQIVTLKATDCMNETSVCTAKVTISDTSAPTMSCQSATINLDASVQATLAVANINNGSTDNCAITAINLNKTSFSCANLGNNTVTLTASDASGNTASCTATVQVKDVIIPVAKCKNITANLNAAGSFALTSAAVNNGSSDNCSFTMLVTPAAFHCGNVGIQTATLRATDNSGNTATCTAVITVKDVTAPTTVCKNAIVNLDDVGQGTLLLSQVNNNSSDACGIATMTLSKTQFNCSEIPGGAQQVILTVKDVNNNSASCISQVTVKDIFAPTAICTNTTVSLGSNGSVTVSPSTLAGGSFDNCSVWSYSPGSKVYTAANIGNNNLTITVKDWSGNAATCVSVVIVQPYSGFQQGIKERGLVSDAATSFDLRLFPNPVSNEQNVTMEFVLPESQAFHFELYDLSGKLIKSQEGEGMEGNNSFSIPLNEVPSGVYIAGFRSGKSFSRTRLVVQ